jgi:hypothetical protein
MTPEESPEIVIESTDEWAELQTYANMDEAAPLLALLSKNGLTYNTLADEHQSGDGLNFDLENRGPGVVHVLVLPDDMERAQRVLALLASEVQDQLEDSDYLAAFTDEELYEVLKKFDEWNQVDYVLAARLLVQRGHQLDNEQLTLWRKIRMQELETPEKASSSFLFGAYLMAILGGVFGLFMGLQLRTHVKRLPDGRKVYGYTAGDRSQSTIIIALSLCSMAVLAFALVSLRR